MFVSNSEQPKLWPKHKNL